MNPEIEKYLKDEKWTEKFKQIKMKKRLYNLSRIVAISVIIFALILLMQRIMLFLKSTHIFGINNIVIEGNKILTTNEILQAGELINIKNIFEVNLKELEKKLELHPRIKYVSVKRKLPNILLISIKERNPIALVNVKEEILYKLYEVDKEGYVIGGGDRISNFDLPVITGITSEKIILGEKINDKNLIKILDILAKVNKKIYNFGRLIAELHIDNSTGGAELTIILNEKNIPVFFGNKILLEKFLKLNSFITVVFKQLNTIEYIDFKYNDIVIKWKQG